MRQTARSRGGARGGWPETRHAVAGVRAGPVALLAVLMLVFALGGSGREDSIAPIVIRPLAGLLLAAGLWQLDPRRLDERRLPLAMAAALLVLPALHLIPLPPSVWQALPQRSLLAAVDREAGLGALWRPFSIAPAATRNALFAALVPVAVVVAGAGLGLRWLSRLVGLAAGFCGASLVLGLVQFGAPSAMEIWRHIDPARDPLAGLLANRNHQGLLLALLVPLLTVLAADPRQGLLPQRLRVLAAVLGAAVVVPMVAAVGSRMGLVLGAAGLAAAPLLVGRAGIARGLDGLRGLIPVARRGGRMGRAGAAVFATGQPGKHRGRRSAGETHRAVPRWVMMAAAGGVVLVLVAGLLWASFLSGRGTALVRLAGAASANAGGAAPGVDAVGELRIKAFGTLLEMVRAVFPFGSGSGTFPRLYLMLEPDSLLDPFYLAHAHNDWIEVAATDGLPGILLLAGGVLAWLTRAWKVFVRLRIPDDPGPARRIRLARLGLVVILLMALASVVDYPLRVPSLAALFALASLWASCPLGRNIQLGDKYG